MGLVAFICLIGLLTWSAHDARLETAKRMYIIVNGGKGYKCNGFYNPCEYLIKEEVEASK